MLKELGCRNKKMAAEDVQVIDTPVKVCYEPDLGEECSHHQIRYPDRERNPIEMR